MQTALVLALFALAADLPADPIAWPSVSTDLPRAGGGEQDAAVVVGISRYAFLPEVPGAADNAADWSQYLTRVRGVPAERMTLLRDSEATREDIERAIRSASASVKPGARVWLVFIGHGAPSAGGDDGVLLGVDTQPRLESLGARGLAQRDVLKLVDGKNTIAIFDACFSGKSADGSKPLVAGMQATVPVRKARTSGALVMSSSATFAGPLPGLTRPAFSYVLLGALRGWGDSDGDRSVTVDEAYRYTKSTLLAALKSNERAPHLEGAAAPSTVLAARAIERGPDVDAIVLGRCPAGTAWRVRACETVACPAGSEWNGRACAATALAVACPAGTTWSGSVCKATDVSCPSGTTWNGARCEGAPLVAVVPVKPVSPAPVTRAPVRTVPTAPVTTALEVERAQALRIEGWRHEIAGNAEQAQATYAKAMEVSEAALDASTSAGALSAAANAKPPTFAAFGPSSAPALVVWAEAVTGFARTKGMTTTLYHKPALQAAWPRALAVGSGATKAAAARGLALLYASVPSFAGGDLGKAAALFDESAQLDGAALETKVARARSLCVKAQDREAFARLLGEVVAATASTESDRVAREEARQLLTRADDLF